MSDFVALPVNGFHGFKAKAARNKSLSHVTAASFNLGHVLIRLSQELSLVSSLKTWHMYQSPIFFPSQYNYACKTILKLNLALLRENDSFLARRLNLYIITKIYASYMLACYDCLKITLQNVHQNSDEQTITQTKPDLQQK